MNNQTKDSLPFLKKVSILRRLRRYFLTGLVVTAPIGITIWITVQIINFFDNLINRFIPDKYNPETYLEHGLPGIGILVVLLILTLIGALAANFLGRVIIKNITNKDN